MIGAARVYFLIFGLLTIVGGVIGYTTKGSVASIVAGAISGILLLVAAFLIPNNATAGLALGAVVSLLLAGRFVPAFLNTGGFMPAGMMAVLSVMGLVLAVVAWIKR